MASPVVEILTFPVSDLFKNHISAIDNALQQARDVDGSGQAYRGREVEDNEVGYVIQVWDSLEHHRRFVNDPKFADMRISIEKCMNHGDQRRTPTVIHVPFTPQNSALQQPLVQVISGKLRNPSTKAAADAIVRALTEKEFEGIATGGSVLEDPNIYVILAGVRTVERGNPHDTGARIMRALGEYMDMDRRHVWIKPFMGINQNDNNESPN